MYDTLHYGRPFRTLNIIDESNREILAIEIDKSLPVPKLVRLPGQLKKIYGVPKVMLQANGQAMVDRLYRLV